MCGGHGIEILLVVCVWLVVAQALFQVCRMWNDPESENIQRIQQAAILQCVSYKVTYRINLQ